MLYSKLRQASTAVLLAGALLASGSMAGAQQAGGISDKLGDAGSKSRAAVDISADSMELREKERKAIFTGNVDAIRGKVKLKADRLVVDYVEVKRKNGTKKTEVRFLNARGNVTIVSADQTITSNRARMDVKANQAVITGNVVVYQGKTKLNGDKLFLNLTTGQSRMEAGGGSGRVRAKFLPKQ
ncbi:MAG: LptA/OstA family protein [Pseudomonadota bacterium]